LVKKENTPQNDMSVSPRPPLSPPFSDDTPRISAVASPLSGTMPNPAVPTAPPSELDTELEGDANDSFFMPAKAPPLPWHIFAADFEGTPPPAPLEDTVRPPAADAEDKDGIALVGIESLGSVLASEGDVLTSRTLSLAASSKAEAPDRGIVATTTATAAAAEAARAGQPGDIAEGARAFAGVNAILASIPPGIIITDEQGGMRATTTTTVSTDGGAAVGDASKTSLRSSAAAEARAARRSERQQRKQSKHIIPRVAVEPPTPPREPSPGPDEENASAALFDSASGMCRPTAPVLRDLLPYRRCFMDAHQQHAPQGPSGDDQTLTDNDTLRALVSYQLALHARSTHDMNVLAHSFRGAHAPPTPVDEPAVALDAAVAAAASRLAPAERRRAQAATSALREALSWNSGTARFVPTFGGAHKASGGSWEYAATPPTHSPAPVAQPLSTGGKHAPPQPRYTPKKTVTATHFASAVFPSLVARDVTGTPVNDAYSATAGGSGIGLRCDVWRWCLQERHADGTAPSSPPDEGLAAITASSGVEPFRGQAVMTFAVVGRTAPTDGSAAADKGRTPCFTLSTASTPTRSRSSRSQTSCTPPPDTVHVSAAEVEDVTIHGVPGLALPVPVDRRAVHLAYRVEHSGTIAVTRLVFDSPAVAVAVARALNQRRAAVAFPNIIELREDSALNSCNMLHAAARFHVAEGLRRADDGSGAAASYAQPYADERVASIAAAHRNSAMMRGM
jgi:hypothetical protein